MPELLESKGNEREEAASDGLAETLDRGSEEQERIVAAYRREWYDRMYDDELERELDSCLSEKEVGDQ